MSAYNKMNGEYCGQNRTLLTDILRHEWGFDGFVHSDWILGVYHPYGAAAGLDIENPEPVHFGAKLIDAVQAGQIAPDVVETACRRILRTLYRFACAEDPLEDYSVDLVACADHRALALEAAEKSAVLLKNDMTLPLSRDQSVGVFGKLANLANTGDFGSSRVRPPYVQTALDGLAAYLDTPDLALAGDEDNPTGAGEAAKAVDVAVLVVGTTAYDEGEYIPGDMGGGLPLPEGAEALLDASRSAGSNGEAGALGGGEDRGGDRTKLRLPEGQVDLIKAVAAANPKTVVVIVSGSAIISTEWADKAGAILQTFYSGMEGGTALARLLFGEVSPSGKLPFTVAQTEGDYPFFDKDADDIEYGPLHGYTLMARAQKTPQYAFGHGLSYARFSYRALKVRRGDQGLSVSVSVRNDGKVPADEIAQIYVGFPGTIVDRPEKLLRGFQRLSLAPGETKTTHFSVPDTDLMYWEAGSRSWRLEPGPHTVFAGGSSRASDLLSRTVVI
ncbi:MAG: glycoside hydrolase family 3 C-terminal domain-containing protein, partial [Pseudomonadota bacterium]